MAKYETELLTPFNEIFIKDADIKKEKLLSVEGDDFDRAEVAIKLLMVVPEFHALKVYFTQGSIIPKHRHETHTSVCVLLSGKLKLFIGDEVFIADPGDVWQHPRGVLHWHEALEDSHKIEIKSPPCKTW